MNARALLVVVIALVVLLLGTILLKHYLEITWFPEVMVAWGTISLAYATWELGRTTTRENDRLLAENRREAALLRIRGWAEKSMNALAEAKMHSYDTTDVHENHAILTKTIGTGLFGVLSDAQKLAGPLYIEVKNFSDIRSKLADLLQKLEVFPDKTTEAEMQSRHDLHAELISILDRIISIISDI